MAYTVPKTWAHGDVPTGAEMNKYKLALEEIKAVLETRQRRNAAMYVLGGANPRWRFVNVHPYLWYRGGGMLQDPANPDNDTALPDTDGAWKKISLHDNKWIYPGKMYQVLDVESCGEFWR